MPSPSASELFDGHRLAVFRFLRRMTGSSAVAAEDLTQEVFLRVVRGLPDYDHVERSRAWVFRIARNVAADAARRASRRPEAVALSTDVAVHPDPTAGIALDEALAALPDLDRELLLLRELGGLDYAEIAAAAGLTAAAVRMRLYRTRSALRNALAPQREQERRKEA